MITILNESAAPKYKINQEVYDKSKDMILKIKDFYKEDDVWYYCCDVPAGSKGKTYEVWIQEDMLEHI